MIISLAPMEGITTYILRRNLNRFYGGIDRFYTPFIGNKTLSYKEIKDLDPMNNEGLTVIPQILTNRADDFLCLEHELKKRGFSEINLNIGCPSGTVVPKKRGAGLLSDLKFLDNLLYDIFEGSSLPISIKTRIGIENTEEFEQILAIYDKYDIKELIIHPRLQKEFYKGSVHLDSYNKAVSFYKNVSSSHKNILLCYNGDIVSKESLEKIESSIGSLDRIMIGRGLLLNPNLANAIKGTPLKNEPSTFLVFHDALLSEYIEHMQGGELQVLFKMKELWVYFASYLQLEDKEYKLIKKTKNLESYRQVIKTIIFSN